MSKNYSAISTGMRRFLRPSRERGEANIRCRHCGADLHKRSAPFLFLNSTPWRYSFLRSVD